MQCSLTSSWQVVVRAQGGDSSDKDFIFACGRWLDDHEEDGKTERELQLSGATSYKVLYLINK